MKVNDTTIETARIAFIVDWLKRHQHNYQWTCVTDSRDVLLQANPFPGISRGVHLYGEQVGRGNFGYGGMAAVVNKRWVSGEQEWMPVPALW
jgi:hypothetical protein